MPLMRKHATGIALACALRLNKGHRRVTLIGAPRLMRHAQISSRWHTPRAPYVLLVVLCMTFFAVEGRAAGERWTCRDSLERFYGWYLQSSWRSSGNSPATRPPDVDPVLWSLFRGYDAWTRHEVEVLKASAGTSSKKGGVIGFDFDPIVGTNGNFDRYELSNLVVNGPSCHASLYLKWRGRDAGINHVPSAIPEMQQLGDHWLLRNVRYPWTKQDLIQMLKTYQR
jgi:hypothetical protein